MIRIPRGVAAVLNGTLHTGDFVSRLVEMLLTSNLRRHGEIILTDWRSWPGEIVQFTVHDNEGCESYRVTVEAC